MNTPRKSPVQVHGHAAYNRPATASVRTLALTVDLSLALAAFCVIHRMSHLNFSESFGALCLTLVGAAALVAPQQLLFGGTLGQRAWGLRVQGESGSSIFNERAADEGLSGFTRSYLNARVYQPIRLGPENRIRGIFSSVLAWAATAGIAFGTLGQNPMLAASGTWNLTSFKPLIAAKSATSLEPTLARGWSIAPYFYALGAWPSHFGGHPILYGLPYQKGPPERFIGNIVARWEVPDVQVTFEGPKTPTPGVPPARIKNCLESLTIALSEPGCLGIREKALSRHIREIRQTVPSVNEQAWVLKWFQIGDPNLPPEERSQGIYLSGGNELRAQDRFVFITPKGTHQAFILDRPNSNMGETAKELFEQAIRSQTIAEGLAPGRDWIDRKLATQSVHGPKKNEDPQSFVERMSELQALLLSKLSVDPKTFDTYFHLAGTAYLLSERAVQAKNTDWTAAAKPMVQSLSKYAQDIAPSDDRTSQIERIWEELRKR